MQQTPKNLYATEPILLLDSDSSHTGRASQTLAAKLGIELLWLPKRAPELNPINVLWGKAKGGDAEPEDAHY